MQDRRGFLQTIVGAALGVATGGLSQVAEALTTKAVSKAVEDFAWVASDDAVFTSYVAHLKKSCTKMVSDGTIRSFNIEYRDFNEEGRPKETKIDLVVTPNTPAEFVTVDFKILPE